MLYKSDSNFKQILKAVSFLPATLSPKQKKGNLIIDLFKITIGVECEKKFLSRLVDHKVLVLL